MDDTNLTKIEGKGENGLFIVESYIKLFNRGYDMTIDEICNYLSCTSTYFLNSHRNEIEHIRINTTARDLIIQFHNSGAINITNYRHLILKRILYNREDFDRFILDNLKQECKYKRFSLEELGFKNLSVKQTILIIDKVNSTLVNKYGIPKELRLESIDYIPENLYSMKDLKGKLNVKHDVEAYRIIQSLGINKYKFNNLVRYNTEDFKGENIIINYNVYKELGENKIRKEIIELIKGLTML